MHVMRNYFRDVFPHISRKSVSLCESQVIQLLFEERCFDASWEMRTYKSQVISFFSTSSHSVLNVLWFLSQCVPTSPSHTTGLLNLSNHTRLCLCLTLLGIIQSHWLYLQSVKCIEFWLHQLSVHLPHHYHFSFGFPQLFRSLLTAVCLVPQYICIS